MAVTKKFAGRKYRSEKGERPEAGATEKPAYKKGGYGKGGGGGYKKGGGEGDDSFTHVTGLFESKSGNSFTVFVKPEMIEKLQELEEDDLLGVSQAKYGMSLWIRKADK